MGSTIKNKETMAIRKPNAQFTLARGSQFITTYTDRYPPPTPESNDLVNSLQYPLWPMSTQSIKKSRAWVAIVAMNQTSRTNGMDTTVCQKRYSEFDRLCSFISCLGVVVSAYHKRLLNVLTSPVLSLYAFPAVQQGQNGLGRPVLEGVNAPQCCCRRFFYACNLPLWRVVRGTLRKHCCRFLLAGRPTPINLPPNSLAGKVAVLNLLEGVCYA